MAHLLQHTEEDRRRARRHNLRTAVRVRVWKSGTPEQKAESLNLSQRGIYFVTDAPPLEGETIEILLNMLEEITGEPTTEWRCTGHVMHIEPIDPRRASSAWVFSSIATKLPASSKKDFSSATACAGVPRRIDSRTAGPSQASS